MQISESFRPVDRPKKQLEVDVRKEAQNMVKKHEQYLTKLRKQSSSSEAFKEASLKATEAFKQQLQTFLSENGREDLYEEMVGFVSGKVSEIVSDRSSESK